MGKSIGQLREGWDGSCGSTRTTWGAGDGVVPWSDGKPLPIHRPQDCGDEGAAPVVPNWFQRTWTERDATLTASLAFIGFARSYVGLRRATSAPAGITNQLLCL